MLSDQGYSSRLDALSGGQSMVNIDMYITMYSLKQ